MSDFEPPNGVVFSSNGRTLHVSDTALCHNEILGPQTGSTHEIQSFDGAADGALSGRSFFCHASHGYLDGFAVDARGWVCATADDGIHVIAPDRTPLGFIPAPSVCANSTFGGAGTTWLFVTQTKFILALDLIA